MNRYRPGDYVVYRKQKYSCHPGRHARDIDPAANGDTYLYIIPKYYRVVAVGPEPTVTVCTRRGRQHVLATNDPALRRAWIWERFLLARRFPVVEGARLQND